MHSQSSKSASGGSMALASPALEWIWNYLRDVAHPHTLDCGPASPATINVAVKREAKLYVADLVAPLQRRDPAYWVQEDKQLVFRLDEFLKLLPPIPAGSLSLICGWHLLDLVPREQSGELAAAFFNLLSPGGVFFCLLRESNLDSGKNAKWWLESPAMLGAAGERDGAFPYPPLSSRDVERLAGGRSLKSFLTRSHRREIVILKDKS